MNNIKDIIEEGSCKHEWSAPVPAYYTELEGYEDHIMKCYKIYISCRKCGEIREPITSPSSPY